MSRSAWAAGMVISLAAAVAVSSPPAATAVVGAAQAPLTVSRTPFHRAVFPLTITRTGGIAGFQDVLVVAGNGRVSITHRGQQQRHCQLTPEAVNRLRTAASQVAWRRITPDSGQARFPDDMVIMVRSPAGGPVRLENPEIGAAGKVFQQLLTDLSFGTAVPHFCTAS
jgi:hypothetical protein